MSATAPASASPANAASADTSPDTSADTSASTSAQASTDTSDAGLSADRYRFPTELLGTLEQGIDVPVRIKTAQGSEEAGRASIRYLGDALRLTSFQLTAATLSDAAQARINARHGEPLAVVAEPTKPHAAPDGGIRLEFDLRTFEVYAELPDDAYAKSGEARSNLLPDSTEQHLSGVVNYDLSAVKNARSDVNSYLHLRSVTGFGVNHAYVEGDLRSNDGSTLYEARVERDFHGINVTGGYLSTWSMTNTLGQISFVPGGRFYGVSVGNVSRSERIDGTLARTPIFVFMPASGEVQIYRDGKLINVQPLALGNQEIDTRVLPVGTYPIRIDTVINGRVVATKTDQVYKPNGTTSGPDSQIQAFLGQYVANGQGNGSNLASPLVGFSGQRVTRFGTFVGSGYVFNGMGALEARYQRDFSRGSLGADLGGTSDGGLRTNLNGSVSFDAGSLWASYGLTTGGSERNGVYNTRMTSFGANLMIGRAFKWRGNAMLNISSNLYQGGQDYRVDLSQDIYTNRWARVTLNIGQSMHRSMGSRNPGWRNAFYAGLNASFTFGDAGIDYSRSRGTEQIGAHVGWRPESIPGVDYLSAGVTHSRTPGATHVGSSSTQGNLGANGRNRWFGWNANLFVDETAMPNGSGSMHGSVGWNSSGIGVAQQQGESGVIVKVAPGARGKLDLVSSSGPMTLGSRSTFVPMASFTEQQVQVKTRRDTPENFEIEDADKTFVLYPGNVASMKPRIRRLVTVFGVLTENGTIKPNAEIRNHIGRATTDADGQFVIDLDSAFPVVEHSSSNGERCEVNFDLSKSQGAVWVDKVECTPATLGRAAPVAPMRTAG